MVQHAQVVQIYFHNVASCVKHSGVARGKFFLLLFGPGIQFCVVGKLLIIELRKFLIKIAIRLLVQGLRSAFVGSNLRRFLWLAVLGEARRRSEQSTSKEYN